MTKHSYLPLALGLMIAPTMTYELDVMEELPRTSVTLNGMPLPWYGDATFGSGPPIDFFIIPALINLGLYVALCWFIWSRIYPHLRARKLARVSASVLIWTYALFGVFVLAFWSSGFGATWLLWYDSNAYGELLEVGFRFFV